MTTIFHLNGEGAGSRALQMRAWLLLLLYYHYSVLSHTLSLLGRIWMSTLLSPPGGIVITRVCLSVCWFVRSLRSLWFLQKYKSDFHEIWRRYSPYQLLIGQGQRSKSSVSGTTHLAAMAVTKHRLNKLFNIASFTVAAFGFESNYSGPLFLPVVVARCGGGRLAEVCALWVLSSL